MKRSLAAVRFLTQSGRRRKVLSSHPPTGVS